VAISFTDLVKCIAQGQEVHSDTSKFPTRNLMQTNTKQQMLSLQHTEKH